jgi:hypothetical protein
VFFLAPLPKTPILNIAMPTPASDVKRLCCLLFLQHKECQNSGTFFAEIATIINASSADVLDSADRLADKNLEERNINLLTRYKDNTLGEDLFDFKVMLCVAFSDGINLRDLVGGYQLDILTIVADMSKDRIEKAIVDAEKQGLIKLPSRGSA